MRNRLFRKLGELWDYLFVQNGIGSPKTEKLLDFFPFFGFFLKKLSQTFCRECLKPYLCAPN